MEEKINNTAKKILTVNTITFTLCFAVWMINGVLVTYLIENQIFEWGPKEMGWLLGIPVLTGALFRLPVGILADKYGGKPVFMGLLLFTSIPTYFLSQATSFFDFAICSFGLGIIGASFSVGTAFTSVWFPKRWQGTALGIFGAGNAGAGLTALFAPTLLNYFTHGGIYPDNWRFLPILYSGILIFTAILFFFLTTNKKNQRDKTMGSLLKPLKSIRVWRFGLYYFLVFGCFVAFSQWLVPYLTNVYLLPLVAAGVISAAFSFPSGIIRALGGWLADKYGPRKVMYSIFGSSILISFVLIFPKLEVFTPGNGIMATENGVVTKITAQELHVNNTVYNLIQKQDDTEIYDKQNIILPRKKAWQESVVSLGEKVNKKQLIAKGVTKIYFQANIWVFSILVIVIGIIWGIGKAAVYKHIADYYPDEVGVVGGMVGVLGGLGGFVCPIIFGYLLDWTGLWTSSWMMIFLISIACLWWMFTVIKQMMRREHPEIVNKIEHNKVKIRQ